MSESFVLETVGKWPLLQTMAGQRLLFEQLAPFLSGPARQPRWGFGPRTLWVLGGIRWADQRGTRSPSAEIYAPQADSWTMGEPMPIRIARCIATAAVLGRKIYVTGERICHNRRSWYRSIFRQIHELK